MNSKKIIRQFVISEIRSLLEKKKKNNKGAGRPREAPNTPLSRYIEKRGDTELVARELGISVPHLNKLARNAALPSLDLAIDIMRATGEMSLAKWDSLAGKKD
jgi:hypothetical protein